jgi:DNA sulfur modification protein DndE
VTGHFTDTVRIDERGKAQLVTLKRRTGLKNWNVLCRWALCISLSEQSSPVPSHSSEMSNVEMTWHTFAGKNDDLFSALIAARCEHDGLGTDRETLAEQFRLHLQRGLTYLLGYDETRSLTGLASLALDRSAE